MRRHLKSLAVLAAFITITSCQLPPCPSGGTASCTCGDGSQPDTSKFPPCDLSKGRPKCSCPNGGEIEKPKRVKPCSQGRPACSDDTAVPWQLSCEDGSQPSAQPGQPPKCASGNLLCMNGEPLLCPDGAIPFSR